MIKAIFFDIDGTLRGFQEYGVRESVYKAIDMAKAAGVKCLVASGRHPVEIAEDYLLGDLKFDGYVYLNGCYCTDGNGNIVYDAPIDPEMVKKSIEMVQDEDFALLVMEADKFYINEASPALVNMHKTIGSRVPQVNPDMSKCHEKAIYQLVIYGEDDVLNSVVERLPLCDPTKWNEGGALDLTPVGVEKCIGVLNTLKHFGIDPSEAAAVGDSFNDIEMLKMVGLGVCMGNGQEATKAVADYVAPHIDDDGLLKAVEYILSRNG